MARLTVPGSSRGPDVRRFVLELDRRLERLDRGILVADWDLYTGRSTAGSSRWQLRRSELLGGPGLLDWIRRARQQSRADAVGRRLQLLERVVVDASAEQVPGIVRLRTELQRKIAAFRPSWDGRRVNRAVVYRALRNDADPDRRRRAYRAFEPLHRSLEPGSLELVRLRNARARELGFRSVPEMRLGFQGLTVARYEELAEEATAGVAAHARRLRDSLPPAERAGGWHPWDLAYARRRRCRLADRRFPTRTMLPRILRAVGRWGFRTDRMRFRVVLHDLPAGGLTLAPDPPDDVRILVHPQGGWDAYHVMFHEVGHAVHSASIRAPRHLLRWHENVPGFGAFHEGIGGLFEEISRDVGWLTDGAGIPRDRAERFAEAHADDDLFAVTGLRTWVLPELRLYDRPDRDPMPEALRLERQLLGVDRSEPRSFVDPFFVEMPIYASNYLLAALFHHQVMEAICRELGTPLWPNRSVGPWLTTNWFADGSTFDWVPRLREVTGRPFGARAFRNDFRAT